MKNKRKKETLGGIVRAPRHPVPAHIPLIQEPLLLGFSLQQPVQPSIRSYIQRGCSSKDFSSTTLTNLSSKQTGEVRRRKVAWPSVGGTFQQRMSKAPLHIGRDLSKSANIKDVVFKGLLHILSLQTLSYLHLIITYKIITLRTLGRPSQR